MPARTRWRLVGLSLIALSVAWITWGADGWERLEMERRQRALWASGVYDEATFERLTVRPDDVLAALPDRGETFAEFAAAHAAGSFSIAGAEIVIVEPLTEGDAASLPAIESTLRALFDVPVTTRTMAAPRELLGEGADPSWDGVALAARIAEPFGPTSLRVGLVEHTLARCPASTGSSDTPTRPSAASSSRSAICPMRAQPSPSRS